MASGSNNAGSSGAQTASQSHSKQASPMAAAASMTGGYKTTSRQGAPPSMTARARRRREEAVRRLVSDVQSAPNQQRAGGAGGASSTSARRLASSDGGTVAESGADGSGAANEAAAVAAETHDWLIASTVATALEKGLDRELHAELVQDAKENAARIGQVCHDHAGTFLSSVAAVASLGAPSATLQVGLQTAQQELSERTVGPMRHASRNWERAQQSHARATTVVVMVQAAQHVATQLERARKQAAAGRPRAALEAVDGARTALVTPIEALFKTPAEQALYRAADATQYHAVYNPTGGGGGPGGERGGGALGSKGYDDDDEALFLDNRESERTDRSDHIKGDIAGSGAMSGPLPPQPALPVLQSLEQTPFGKRASLMLPRIENEVLMGARRALNRWFLRLRQEGDASKVGRSALRQCAEALAVGPGSLALGGYLPSSYVWRAKTADNWLARLKEHSAGGSKVVRAARAAYWFDRDAPREAERLEAFGKPGIERKAEVIASAFGWYRCWAHDSSLLVDPSEFAMDGGAGGTPGLSGSRHGTGGSRHGSLRGSRHGRNRSLGFRASTSSRSQAFQDMTSTLGAPNVKTNLTSKWNTLMSPSLLYEVTPTNKKEEDETLVSLPESVHPVRRAELAFSLLGRSDEFIQYYEQNRYGETKVGIAPLPGAGSSAMLPPSDNQGERKSVLSALTGDDVSLGNDRMFFRKNLSQLCASVVGFCAVEAALELGNFADEPDVAGGGGGAGVEGSNSANPAASTSAGGGAGEGAGAGGEAGNRNPATLTSAPAAGIYLSSSRFRESSERYERALLTEIGTLLRARSARANLGEMVRASNLMVAFRAALKTIHPGSTSRRFDKELLNLNLDIIMAALKVVQEEQLQATMSIVSEDQKVPMLVSDFKNQPADLSLSAKKSGVPDPEHVGLPFGLIQLKQKPQESDLEFQEQTRTSYNRAMRDEAFTFSESVPLVMRSIHARAIACAAFALSQESLGQRFSDKRGGASASACFVLDCVEECVNVAVVAMKDSEKVIDEGSTEKAVQVMANIAALQHCLPRLYGTLMRGMCHVGLIRSDQIDETFVYAEQTLKAAEKSCDAQVGSTYSLVYEICRNKIDSHINYALEGFQWVAKSEREQPNAYCTGLVGYLKAVFSSLGPIDEGSRAGLHLSCCSHVSERLVKLLAGKPGDTTTFDDSGIAPIARIDAFGIKNLLLDCEEFERFADSCGIPQLRDCFSELRVLTSVMLDKDLPVLLLPENTGARRRKYPILSMDKVANILEKYVGTGLGDKLMGGNVRSSDMLFIDKKEVQQLIKIARSQVH